MTTPVQTSIALSDKTTYKIGGPARFYVEPSNQREISEAIGFAREQNAPVFVLGRGSNVLISDRGWPGMVIDVSARFECIEWNGGLARCQSGAQLNRLVREMLDRGLCGLENLGGIPGTIGGALVMNAGAFDQSVSDCLVSADYLDLDDMSIRAVAAEGFQAGYRTSFFKGKNAFILSATFRFPTDPSGGAREVFNQTLVKRAEKHPLDLPNCGSVFKNIPPYPASVLIEQCGLKGLRHGGAEVSCKHANFIVNRDHASAEDVRRLIAQVQKTVFEMRGILLEPEVIFVGEFDEPLFVP
jgi:UDP-N-acetylmuramate dehydrogenase